MKRNSRKAWYSRGLAMASALGLLAGAVGAAQERGKSEVVSSAQAVTGVLDVSLMKEVAAAEQRALDWLAARQKADGSWSNPQFPALTALALWAFTDSDHPAKGKVVSNAVSFIKKYVQADGSIYATNVPGKGGGLANYNTAICMVALHKTGDPSLRQIVMNARKYVAASQHLQGYDMYTGGMGYDQATGRLYTDLSDSVMAFEAMRMTQAVEDTRPSGEKKVDLDWQAATQFLGRVQSKEDGGFGYRPDESKAGATTNKEGAVVLRSYASMTYAGLLSLVYAQVSKEDPRVQAAVSWAMKHWSLEENPGMGGQGLYYFYNILPKSLAAYGVEKVPVPGGAPISWREELAKKLLSLQKMEKDGSGQGYWLNENNRFWESDPVLVTSFSLIALEVAAGQAR
jgi:squalene-hopene/tetraprenyl-beta-curcumene cyclase